MIYSEKIEAAEEVVKDKEGLDPGKVVPLQAPARKSSRRPTAR